ncbi:hypothetical protein [Salinibacterium sp. SWN1162]|uniref:hypothetical protein n=1 Tax=Salinibacterium sp. SWN1162 TaxID=2792053 RepID=UPI0018CE9E8C|nr:hypothetical protein [Salinibacterium sp. SWN1162]MBH0008180.1 hypothetical protein [Salinibacterium sp. SWN1162]
MKLPTRLTVTAVPFAILAFTLAGCTNDGTDGQPEPEETSSSAEQTPGVTDISDAPGTGEDLEGALTDSTVNECERTGDEWTVSGVVTNSTDASVTYRIYVSLLNGANDTRALTQVDVDATEPGDTSDWETVIPVAEDELTCVLRVERYES